MTKKLKPLTIALLNRADVPTIRHRLWQQGHFPIDPRNPWNVSERTVCEAAHVLLLVYGEPHWPKEKWTSARFWIT